MNISNLIKLLSKLDFQACAWSKEEQELTLFNFDGEPWSSSEFTRGSYTKSEILYAEANLKNSPDFFLSLSNHVSKRIAERGFNLGPENIR